MKGDRKEKKKSQLSGKRKKGQRLEIIETRVEEGERREIR